MRLLAEHSWTVYDGLNCTCLFRERCVDDYFRIYPGKRRGTRKQVLYEIDMTTLSKILESLLLNVPLMDTSQPTT